MKYFFDYTGAGDKKQGKRAIMCIFQLIVQHDMQKRVILHS
jgi:hypothetical protein